jgi:hypothetical protein
VRERGGSEIAEYAEAVGACRDNDHLHPIPAGQRVDQGLMVVIGDHLATISP